MWRIILIFSIWEYWVRERERRKDIENIKCWDMEDHLDLFHLRILPLLFPLWVDFSILPAICWYIFYIYFYLFLFIVFFYLSTVSIYLQYSASHLLILYIFLQYTRISISFCCLHSVLLSIHLLTYLQYTARHMLVHLSKNFYLFSSQCLFIYTVCTYVHCSVYRQPSTDTSFYIKYICFRLGVFFIHPYIYLSSVHTVYWQQSSAGTSFNCIYIYISFYLVSSNCFSIYPSTVLKCMEYIASHLLIHQFISILFHSVFISIHLLIYFYIFSP